MGDFSMACGATGLSLMNDKVALIPLLRNRYWEESWESGGAHVVGGEGAVGLLREAMGAFCGIAIVLLPRDYLASLPPPFLSAMMCSKSNGLTRGSTCASPYMGNIPSPNPRWANELEADIAERVVDSESKNIIKWASRRGSISLEDARQDALVAACHAVPTFSSKKGKIDHFVNRCVKRALVTRVLQEYAARRRKVDIVRSDWHKPGEIPSRTPDPRSFVRSSQNEAASEVSRRINLMSPNQLRILRLRSRGLSCKEASMVMGIGLDEVYELSSKARKRLMEVDEEPPHEYSLKARRDDS